MSLVISDEFKLLASKALSKWGAGAQMRQTIEECAELIVELAKAPRNSNGTDTDRLIEEMVDVELMLGQMKVLFEPYMFMWDMCRKAKLEKLKKRLDK